MLAQTDFPGPDGFLGTRASLMLDVVALAMFLVVGVLAWSIAQARAGRYVRHKWAQGTLASVLLVVVVVFEVEVRFYGWTDRAAGQSGGAPSRAVWTALYVHLVFAISSFVLWPVVVVRALRRFPTPPKPGEHSRSHVFWARIAAGDMFFTAVTGWVFYWLAFVA